jgi:hypothetical protein
MLLWLRKNLKPLMATIIVAIVILAIIYVSIGGIFYHIIRLISCDTKVQSVLLNDAIYNLSFYAAESTPSRYYLKKCNRFGLFCSGIAQIYSQDQLACSMTTNPKTHYLDCACKTTLKTDPATNKIYVVENGKVIYEYP